MFKFNFDLDDLIDDPGPGLNGTQHPQQQTHSQTSNGDRGTSTQEEEEELPCKDIPIQTLLDSLPPIISYSPLNITTPTKTITLPRRDLFDVRFQSIAQSDNDDSGANAEVDEDNGHRKEGNYTQHHGDALKFIEAPSDLVPRVYEGGLKTWECSIDLVEYLDSTYAQEGFCGKRILELGCGTAIPTLYILQHIFYSTPGPCDTTAAAMHLPQTVIYLQDYNSPVLELITLPNILLTWYLSPASHPYRTNTENVTTKTPSSPSSTTHNDNELSISPALLSAFLTSLTKHYNISLHFFSGSWSSFTTLLLSASTISTTHSHHPQQQKFDLVLTSETIYRMESIPSLVETMQLSILGTALDHSNNDQTNNDNSTEMSGTCLIAAKVLYFGVIGGGGISSFVDYIEEKNHKTKVVKEITKEGVGRVILSLDFFCWSVARTRAI